MVLFFLVDLDEISDVPGTSGTQIPGQIAEFSSSAEQNIPGKEVLFLFVESYLRLNANFFGRNAHQ